MNKPFILFVLLFLQSSRSVLHYAARCENPEKRALIDDECTKQGADKLAKDSVNIIE